MSETPHWEKSLIDAYVDLNVANASMQAERDLLAEQLREAQAVIRKLNAWRLQIVAAIPMAASLSNPPKTRSGKKRSLAA